MHAILLTLAAMSLAQPEVSSDVPRWPASPELRRFEVSAGASLGLRPTSGTFGGTGLLSLSARLLPFLRPELAIGYGLFDAPFQLVTVIRIGARVELPLAFPVRPYLWLAFAHNHEVGVDEVALHPLDSLLGTSEHGVHHRSGVELGVGASFDVVQFRKGAVGLRVGVRATAALFLGAGPAYGDLLTTLGTTF